jgi:hypothetical protein
MIMNIEFQKDSLLVTVKEPFTSKTHIVSVPRSEMYTFFSYLSGNLGYSIDDLKTLSEDDRCLLSCGLTCSALKNLLDLKMKEREDTIYDDEELLRDDY